MSSTDPVIALGLRLFHALVLGVFVLQNPFSACAAPLPAFPGAEGFGRFATGGRGGTVYRVTNTNDSGPGSFRDAVSVSGRTVIFDVGGVIDYKAPRYAPKPNITIAGQTAPGDGVTLYGNGLSFSGANNNIVRFLRVRQGVKGDSGTDALGIANGHTMIFDHLAVSWGRDETFSISGNITNITIQSTIIAQGLQSHSAGGLIQTPGGVSILRSLYVDNDTRNPKVKFKNEFVNNVICNWETIGYNMGGDSAGDSFVNMFNNYFIRGPASSSTAIGGGNLNFHIYASNNWYDGNRNGILDGTELPIPNYGSMDLQSVPFPYPVTTAYSPLTALKLAISDVGPSFRRDSVDERLITELISWGTLGGTITSELLPPMNGPGIVRNGTPYPDSDNDGMPDFWESGTGSNPNVADNNSASPSGSGYTRLEDYLNWLAEPHGIALMNTNVVIDLRQFTRGWVVLNRNPVWSAGNAVNGSVALINGCFAQFTPDPGWHGSAGFQFTVNDDDGEPLTRTMNLLFTPAAQPFQSVWRGDDIANKWNRLGDFNWHDGISLMYPFHDGDSVLFDDNGSVNPAVSIEGVLQPGFVTVDAARHYAFAGNGSLGGTMALTKNNSGTLTIQNVNTYSGATTVSNGTLLVHGALTASPVMVRSRGTIGGSGSLGNGLTVFNGGSIVPGNGNGAAGTLTITNGLTMAGGVTNRFDLSDDAAGTTKTNDVVDVIGDLTLSGVNAIRVSLLDGVPGNGVYTLIRYSGNLNGSLANLVISGVSGTLTNPPGSIAMVVDAQRPPAFLLWAGDNVSNIWDEGTNVVWLNEGAPDRFSFLDEVLFDNTGSTAPSVNLHGVLAPASVTVAADVHYTFSGSGRISGTTVLVKTNSGTLTLNTTNDFTGPMIIGGGVVSVGQLANGGVPSSIGAGGADFANLQLFNSTLRYSGATASLNRGATLFGSGTIEVVNGGATVTWNGTNTGSGSLIKSGPGTLALSAGNSYSGGTVLKAGMLALSGPAGGGTVTANNYAMGSGSVTFQGGTLKLFGHGLGFSPSYGTFSRPMIVPEGETGTLLTPPRYTMSAPLSGSGTLNLEVNYVRGTLNGNWSAFTGLINVTALVADSEFRIANSSGYAGATLFLNNNVVITRSGSAITVEIGALGGTGGSRIGPGNSTSSGSSYRVGWNNEDATFAGRILADGANTVTKVGTGNWRLSGANTYSGGTIVSNGTLTVNNTSGSATGTGAVTVHAGATLAGAGSISGSTTVAAGAVLSPGDPVGTLKFTGSLSLNNGSLLELDLGTAGDLVTVGGALNANGVIHVRATNGFGPGTYTLFTSPAIMPGNLSVGSMPAGYSGVVNTQTPGQIRLVVTESVPPVMGNVSFANGQLIVTGSGSMGVKYRVLTSTNLTVAPSLWTPIFTNFVDASGSFQFTNSVSAPGGAYFRLELLP
ncbi:MAG TPA: autotransporter-associated beta strand repeat-containing protein [Verrucomicrobiae bacterium]|nr:autotransporter-associated beta strand repeat-containing protein [Verrucomicrobiae bacterium]